LRIEDRKFMSVLSRNVIANYIGTGWTYLLSVIFTPVYIKIIGIESYGLIGFFASLQVFLFLLDMGLSTTLNREFARMSTMEGTIQEMHDLLKTFSMVYWGIAVVAGLLMLIAAPVLAKHWLKSTIAPSILNWSVFFLGIGIALKWPSSVYGCGLLGLQRQVTSNVLSIILATLRSGGVVLILLFVSRTVLAFFAWQIVVNILQIVLYAYFLYRFLPAAPYKARFRVDLFKRLWALTAGLSGINILATFIAQADKITLSKMLPLEQFGYYTLAGGIAALVIAATWPISGAFFPRFTQLVAQKNEATLISMYHYACRMTSIIVIPACILVLFYGEELLLYWLRDPLTAHHTTPLLKLLMIGTTLNALVTLPYIIQLSYGWTQLAFCIHCGAAITVIPLTIFMVLKWGASGAASGGILMYTIWSCISIIFMHQKILKGELSAWVLRDVGLPIVLSIASIGLFKLFCFSMVPKFIIIAISMISCLAVLLFAMPDIRSILLSRLRLILPRN
jgi:O-antigen/teichoic acid export membrane protein